KLPWLMVRTMRLPCPSRALSSAWTSMIVLPPSPHSTLRSLSVHRRPSPIFLGSILLAWAGEAERAIEWGERGLRLSPLDPWRFSAFYAAALGHFHRGHYEEAAAAARKAVQYSPAFSQTYMVLAATVAKLGRLEEAKAAAARVLELQPA